MCFMQSGSVEVLNNENWKENHKMFSKFNWNIHGLYLLKNLCMVISPVDCLLIKSS